MVTRYRDSVINNPEIIGGKFEDYVIYRLSQEGIYLAKHELKDRQFQYGDAYDNEGAHYEIKLDNWCDKPPGRLSIEIAERRNKVSLWVHSGIFSRSQATYYIQGNFNVFWMFLRSDLRQWYSDNDPDVYSDNPPTISKFYINLRYNTLVDEDDWTYHLPRGLNGFRYLSV